MAPSKPEEEDEPQEPGLSELTLCPRTQKNAIDIKALERQLKASGEYTPWDRKVFAMMSQADHDGNGSLSALELYKAFHAAAEAERTVKVQRRMLIGAMVFMLLLLLGNGGLIALVTAIYKDTYVRGDTTMSDADGQVVGTRAATHNLPLIVAPVLPNDELFSVETIRFELPGTTVDPNEAGSGASDGAVGPSVLSSVRITRVDKVNRTAVVFHGAGGEEVRVWNGVTTVRLSAAGAEIPICSADVTCAAFQVEGAALAEKYLAEAEALLAPFEEGRRRLAADCEDPFPLQRTQAQVRATELCQATTEHACRILALRNGLALGGMGYTFAGDDDLGYLHGCYTYHARSGGWHGSAYFGNGGSTQSKQQAPSDSTAQRVSSLDLDCLLLSNQAKLEENQRTITLNQLAILSEAQKPARLVATAAIGGYVTNWLDDDDACGWCLATGKCYYGYVANLPQWETTCMDSFGRSAFRVEEGEELVSG